jgi:hypothetical protein
MHWLIVLCINFIGSKVTFMKRLFFLFVLFSFANAFAQGEFLNNSNTISGSSISLPKSKAPSVFNPTAKPNSSTSVIEKKPLEFAQNNTFANPGDLYKEKLNTNETGENYKIFRKNQYLGDVKTGSEYAKISYRDFGEVDGDEIRIWVNDKIVVEHIFLDGNFNGIQLGLIKGFNKVDFEALNQGTSGPNTAEFRIFDDKGGLISSNQWNLATGFKATIIIVKD